MHLNNSLLLFFLIISLSACNTPEANTSDPANSSEQIGLAETFADLAPLFEKDEQSTYIINFWATTCPPCIKEMPHFEALNKNAQEKQVKVLLVSLDMKRDLETRVKPFLKKYNIQSEVVLLADQNYSAWTEKIDTSWYGALPATLIKKGAQRKFFFGAFESLQDLEEAIEF